MLTDYYLTLLKLENLRDSSASTITQLLKEQFSRHGIPDTLVSDNKPHFTNHDFHQFSQVWEFQHVTSSPHHHKSNGKAESRVKVAESFQESSQKWKRPMVSFVGLPKQKKESDQAQPSDLCPDAPRLQYQLPQPSTILT